MWRVTAIGARSAVLTGRRDLTLTAPDAICPVRPVCTVQTVIDRCIANSGMFKQCRQSYPINGHHNVGMPRIEKETTAILKSELIKFEVLIGHVDVANHKKRPA